MATASLITSFDRSGLRPTQTRVTTIRDLFGIVGGGLKKTPARPTGRAEQQALAAPSNERDPVPMNDATLHEMHGRMGDPSWSAPRRTVFCDADARPGYASKKAHEYMEEPAVLRAKVKLLADLLRRSRNCLAYTGAGISTASGIGDYATRDEATVDARPKLRSPWEAQPTKAHRVLTALHHAGMLKHWVQQNHDGLPQKAGYPQHAINEIHGGWYDPSNPVVPMSGQLRGDLFQWMLDWEQETDLVLALGSSLCGMNADRMVVTPANKATRGDGLGVVIVSLQRTQHDDLASLRIYATLDEVFTLLAEEMGLDVAEEGTRYTPRLCQAEGEGDIDSMPADTFPVRYDSAGNADLSCERLGSFVLDLREGSRVRLTSGPNAGDEGVVLGRNLEGHWRITFRHRLKKTSKILVPFQRVLGSWWVEAAIHGTVDRIPVVSVDARRWPGGVEEGTKEESKGDAVACGADVAAQVALHYKDEQESDRPYDFSHVFDRPPPPSLLDEIRRVGHVDDSSRSTDE